VGALPEGRECGALWARPFPTAHRARQMGGERRQGLAADVMLDAFRVRLRHGAGDADCHQELDDQVVAIARLPGQLPSRRGEEDGPVGLGRDESAALETLQRPPRGDVGHADRPGDIGQPGLAPSRDEAGNELHVILRQLVGVLTPDARRGTSHGDISGDRSRPRASHRRSLDQNGAAFDKPRYLM
jgi:hypothetical protein